MHTLLSTRKYTSQVNNVEAERHKMHVFLIEPIDIVYATYVSCDVIRLITNCVRCYIYKHNWLLCYNLFTNVEQCWYWRYEIWPIPGIEADNDKTVYLGGDERWN